MIQDREYAGFWRRFGALIIDMVLMIPVIYLPLILIYGEEYWLGEAMILGFWDVLLSYILPFVGTIWFWRRYRGTPGKMATKLEIVDAQTGNSISTGQALGRYFAYIISMVPFCAGFLWVGIDKRKQGWHDKLAGTLVLHKNSQEPVRFEQNDAVGNDVGVKQ
jgi:uncharacterized RDD family membrane protein YckC